MLRNCNSNFWELFANWIEERIGLLVPWEYVFNSIIKHPRYRKSPACSATQSAEGAQRTSTFLWRAQNVNASLIHSEPILFGNPIINQTCLILVNTFLLKIRKCKYICRFHDVQSIFVQVTAAWTITLNYCCLNVPHFGTSFLLHWQLFSSVRGKDVPVQWNAKNIFTEKLAPFSRVWLLLAPFSRVWLLVFSTIYLYLVLTQPIEKSTHIKTR